MAAEKKIELNLRDMLERVWRNRDNIFLFQLVTIVLTLFVVLFWPRTYASEAQLFLQRGRESVGLDPTAATGQTIALQQSGRDGEIKTAMEVLSSRGVIEPVVDSLGPAVVLGNEALEDAPDRTSNPIAESIRSGVGWLVTQIRKIDPASDRERAIVAIERNMTIDAERKSEVIRVVFEADSPELAQHVVNGIVAEYTRKHPQLHATKGSAQFFEDQSDRLSNEFQAVSGKLSKAKNEIGLVSIVEQTNILETQLGAVRSDIMNTEKLLTSAQARSKDLRTQLSRVPERLSQAAVTKPNHATDLQSQSLFNLKIRLSEAQAKFRPNHPTVVSLQNSVSQAQQQFDNQKVLRKESTDNVNPVHESLKLLLTQSQADVAGLKAAEKKLATQETEALAAIRKLNDDSIAIRLLEVEAKTAETKLVSYGASLEDARVDEERQSRSMSSVTVSQPATLQEKPVSPSKPIAALVGMMMCAAGSLLVALLSIQSDDTLISPYAVSSNIHEVPILGSLPRSRSFSKVLA